MKITQNVSVILVGHVSQNKTMDVFLDMERIFLIAKHIVQYMFAITVFKLYLYKYEKYYKYIRIKKWWWLYKMKR